MQFDLLELERLGMLALIADVLLIESGQLRGRWATTDGRLWVIVD